MSEQKLRRKTFLATLGAAALGAVGLRSGAASSNPDRATGLSLPADRVKKDPRSVPCSGRTL